ncbi:hypothetical protein I3760_15G038500 [Carya illinoinensis]|nr:hypothetical protein I3760_15G038500 [Carya illinoinensis]
MMENNLCIVPTDMGSQSPVVIDGFPPRRNVARDASLCHSRLSGNTQFQDQAAGGAAISAASHATFPAAKFDLQENLNNLAILAPSICPLDVLRTYASNGCSNASFATSLSCGYEDVLGNTNTKWETKYPAPLELVGKSPVRAELQPFSSTASIIPDGWMSSHSGNVTTNAPYSSSNFNNELSLTLATSEPSVLNEINIPDQCSEMGMSGVTRHCLNETTLSSEQTCNSKELSVSFGSYRSPEFSQVILGSRYLHVIQEILAQIANHSLENLDHMSYPTARNEAGSNIPFSSSVPAERWMSSTVPDVDGGLELQMEFTLQRRTVEAKKAQLLTLLQVVDDQYSQCVDEIHTVISAFHAATELDPQIHARFALQTVSFLYRNLRERISNYILAMGAHFNSTCKKEKKRSFETSFIQKQWALQQLKSKDHQLWRPQRGLPERSVSVLRAWMFQNFLHPYPKDAEKHLLAVKSGLTRSQVSNWFINARVRLWKPMIEEMYAEMNRRKVQRDKEGTQSNHRNNMSITNHRFSST